MVECQAYAIPNEVGLDVTHVRAGDAAPDQHTTGLQYEVNIHARIGQEPRTALDQRTGVGDIDDVEIMTGARPYPANRLAWRRDASACPARLQHRTRRRNECRLC